MLKLSEIMTREVVTVAPETTLREAVELFTSKHISGAPVVSGQQVVGVVSASDILEFAAALPDLDNRRADDSSWTEREEEGQAAEAISGSYYTELFAGDSDEVGDRIAEPGGVSVLDAHTVDEVMTHNAIALSPNESVLSAADVMRGRSIHRVLVVDHGKLVGILSTLDLARAVAEHKLMTKTYVFNKDSDFDPSRSSR